jgi:hypothetical protein
MLQNIVKIDFEDDDEEDEKTGVQQSSSVCLSKISKLIGNQVLDPVLAFVR